MIKGSLYHISINISNPSISIPFYKDFLSYLDYKIIVEGYDYIGFTNGKSDFWFIGVESAYLPVGFDRHNIGLNHLAFILDSKEEVDEFNQKFLAFKKIKPLYDSPKLWSEYYKDYYAVFFEDPDGIKLEVVYRSFEEKKRERIAFIDGQNLHLGTKDEGWKVDLRKFRVYLNDKYKIDTAYYFLGHRLEEQVSLYKNLDKAGFITIFKEHDLTMISKKKGNVDGDIIFEIMKNIFDNPHFHKAVIVSGDGDYKKIINYLIKKDKFEKILFPNSKYASSLFFYLKAKSFDYLKNVKSNIQMSVNEKGS
jgi:catechol 2,3-dioxygenase-like lactoylglutathione lyase family enzyme